MYQPDNPNREKRSRVLNRGRRLGVIPMAQPCSAFIVVFTLSLRENWGQTGAFVQTGCPSMTASWSLSTGLAVTGPWKLPTRGAENLNNTGAAILCSGCSAPAPAMRLSPHRSGPRLSNEAAWTPLKNINRRSAREFVFEKVFSPYEANYDAILVDVAPSITMFQTCAMIFCHR